MHNFSAVPFVSFVFLALLSTPSIAGSEDCEFIAAAYAKLVAVPYRQVINTNGKVMGEFVSINNMLYAKVTDSWDKMPYPEKTRRANMNKLFDTLSIKECARQPDGQHVGKDMSVYSYTVPPMEGMSTEPSIQTIFIGRDDGLPHLMAASATQVELFFENIAAPVE